MSNKYFKKKIEVRGHDRFDPRVGKKVAVGKYDRNQRYRNYEEISKKRAKELFNQRSQRAKSLDLRSTSKKVFEEPNEYWEEHMNRSDVKNMDTEQKKWEKDWKKAEDVQEKLEKANIEKLKDKILNKEKLTEEELALLPAKWKKVYEAGEEIKKLKKDIEKPKKKKGFAEALVENQIKQSKVRTTYKELKEKLKGKEDKWNYNTEGSSGLMSDDRIAMYQTKEDFKESPLHSVINDYEEIELENQYVVSSGIGLYQIARGNYSDTYLMDYIDEALSVLKNPIIYYKKNFPLLIKDNTHAFIVAPRFDDGDNEDEVIMSYEKYKDIDKDYNKKELIERIKKFDKDANVSSRNKKVWLISKYHELDLKNKYPKDVSAKEVMETIGKAKKEYDDQKKAILKQYSGTTSEIIKKSKYEKQLEELSEKSKRFYELSDEEKKRIKREGNLNYIRSPEAFEEYNPNKNAIYRGKETKAYIEWKNQFKTKPKPKYLLGSRPIDIGTVPLLEKVIGREDWKPSKENNYNFGYVQYNDNLSFEDIYKYELTPDDDIEYANYMFWIKNDKNKKEAEKIKKQYLEMPLEELEKWRNRDPFSNYAYLIKKTKRSD